MKRGKPWKHFLVFCALFLLLSPAFSESETELEIEVIEVPVLEPEAIYEMTGQDIMTLYQTINNLNETKNEYKNLTNEMLTTSQNALKLAKEYAEKNKKLTLQNNFLIGGITISAGICVVGTIALIVMNAN